MGGASRAVLPGTVTWWNRSVRSSGPCLRHVTAQSVLMVREHRQPQDDTPALPVISPFPPHPKVDSHWGVCPGAGQKGSKGGVLSTKERGKEKKRERRDEFCVLLWCGVARPRGLPTMLMKGLGGPFPIDLI